MGVEAMVQGDILVGDEDDDDDDDDIDDFVEGEA